MSQRFDKSFIRQVKKELTKELLERMLGIAIVVHNRLTIRTPVDEGTARRGWNFTLNEIDLSTPSDLGEKGSSSNPLRPQESRPNQEAKKLSDKYNLTNAVPHIVWLNEGSSDKAPPNFVEEEVIRGTNRASI